MLLGSSDLISRDNPSCCFKHKENKKIYKILLQAKKKIYSLGYVCCIDNCIVNRSLPYFTESINNVIWASKLPISIMCALEYSTLWMALTRN